MTLVMILGAILVIVGLWGMLTQKNLIKIIIGFTIIDTGIHLIIVSIGYIQDRTAPILDNAVDLTDAVNQVVDPVPSALVLTSIVIGLAVTALMLSYVVRLYKEKKTLNIDKYNELKW